MPLFCLSQLFLRKALRFPAILSVFMLLPISLFAQTYGPLENRFFSIQQNATSTLAASGNTVWTGPGLNAFFENSNEIYIPQNADSVFSGRGRVFSLAVENDRILAGLGFTSDRSGDPVQAAQGYYFSIDNGVSWKFIKFPLDSPPDEDCSAESAGPPCDVEFVYGGETYIRTRVTVPEQSPPYEVAFKDNVVLSVNWASGLLRSRDAGDTWERIILPPSTERELSPGRDYSWLSQTPEGNTLNRYDPRFDNNLLGFGLLIDNDGRVWVGTAGGINISENALTAPSDQISWERVSFDPSRPDGLMANWIITIRQQPGTGRIWMTNWRTDPQNLDSEGIVYTEDGGKTFHHFLEGVRVNDIGFWNGAVFAAANNGFYYSKDNGHTWEQIEQIQSPNSFFESDTPYFALAATGQNLWVGTGDGIASTDDAETWRIIRTDVPLSGGNIYQPEAPSVETYAYPNPFSPRQHDVVRLKYDVEQAGPVSIEIFDFAMHPVRSLSSNVSVAGAYETPWDGTDENNRVVANGTYFYIVETPDGVAEGKILLLE